MMKDGEYQHGLQATNVIKLGYTLQDANRAPEN